MYMLLWRSGSVRAFNASGPGFDSTQGNIFFWFTFFWISFFFVSFFFKIIITSQSLRNNLKYIAGFKLFSVGE